MRCGHPFLCQAPDTNVGVTSMHAVVVVLTETQACSSSGNKQRKFDFTERTPSPIDPVLKRKEELKTNLLGLRGVDDDRFISDLQTQN